MGLLASLLWVAPPAGAGDSGERTTIPYDVIIEGMPNRGLRKAAEALSAARQDRDRPPATPTQLRHRAEQDLPRLERLLQSRGWMNARVTAAMETDARPARVVFLAHPGPRFRIGALSVESADGAELPRSARPDRQLSGAWAETARLLAEERRLIQSLQDLGHPWPRLAGRTVQLRPESETLDVAWVLDPGPPARFGPLETRGLVRTREAFVRNRVQWEEGDPFRQESVRATETRLLGTGLFTSVRLSTPAAPADRPEDLPMRAELLERRPMTARVGLEYQSDTGFGGKASWEHRNLLGSGERVEVSGRVAEERQDLNLGFSFPDGLGPEIRLDLGLGYLEETPDAFERRASTASATVTWPLAPRWTMSVGAALETSRVDDRTGLNEYLLVSSPVRLEYSDRDHALDPTRGWRITSIATPYLEMEEGQAFTRVELHVAHYLSVSRSPRVTLALRGGVGTLAGASVSQIPANLRYYAGGGTSIRGFAHQSVGSDDQVPPTGGNAVAETSAELRLQFTRWGWVAFVDAGDVFDRDAPGGSLEPKWSTGVGIRYATPIGPVRVDAAVPMDRRPQDDPWQVYVSIGQAF